MTLANLTAGEYPVYYQKYLDQLPQEDIMKLLNRQKKEMILFLEKLEEDDLKLSYAAGKWTVGQVLQHLFDTERIFQYRALRISRGDRTPLPGYDQDLYVPASFANDRNREELIEEYRAIRASGISLFNSFNLAMLKEKGVSSGGELSAAAAGFIIVGHEKHHLNLFKSLYNL